MKSVLIAAAFVFVAIPIAFALPMDGSLHAVATHFAFLGEASTFASP